MDKFIPCIFTVSYTHLDVYKRQGLHMKLQQLYSYTRKAIDHYQLIESGDKIAIGISGGKDSLTLLYKL